jgi:hypothetical protein
VHSDAREQAKTRRRIGPASFGQVTPLVAVAAITSPVAMRPARQMAPSCQPQSREHRASQAPETGEPSAANNGHIVAGQNDAGMVTAGTTVSPP